MSAVEARSGSKPRDVAGGNGRSSLITDQPRLFVPSGQPTDSTTRLFLAGAVTPKIITDTIQGHLSQVADRALVLPSVLSPFDHYDPDRYSQMADFLVEGAEAGHVIVIDNHSLGLLDLLLVNRSLHERHPGFVEEGDLSNAHLNLWTTAGPHYNFADTWAFSKSLLRLGDTLLGVSPAARGPVSIDLAAPIGVDVARLEKVIDVVWSDRVHSDETWTDLEFVGDSVPYTEWANERSTEALAAADADLASLLSRVVIDTRGRRGIKTERSRKLYLHDADDHDEIKVLLDSAMRKRANAVGTSLFRNRILHNADLAGLEVNLDLPSGISGWTQALLGLPAYMSARVSQLPAQFRNGKTLVEEMYRSEGAQDVLTQWNERGARINFIVPGLDELSPPSAQFPFGVHRYFGTHLLPAISPSALIEAPNQIRKNRRAVDVRGSVKVDHTARQGVVYAVA